MNYIGPVLFGLFFVFMSAEARAKTGNFIDSVMNWIDAARPVSYMVLGVFAACALLAFLLVVRWPSRADEINPLVQYRRDHPDMDE